MNAEYSSLHPVLCITAADFSLPHRRAGRRQFADDIRAFIRPADDGKPLAYPNLTSAITG